MRLLLLLIPLTLAAAANPDTIILDINGPSGVPAKGSLVEQKCASKLMCASYYTRGMVSL
jgi:hypothetical protein